MIICREGGRYDTGFRLGTYRALLKYAVMTRIIRDVGLNPGYCIPGKIPGQGKSKLKELWWMCQ